MVLINRNMRELGLLLQMLLPTSSLELMFKLLSKLVYYSYFQVNDDYYIFAYARSQILREIILNILYSNCTIVKNIKANQRRFRSLRGFCLYILKLKETGKNFQVLKTNLQKEFWDEVSIIIRQKNKSKLEQYLFNFHETTFDSESFILKNFEQPINDRLEITNNTRIIHLNNKN